MRCRLVYLMQFIYAFVPSCSSISSARHNTFFCMCRKPHANKVLSLLLILYCLCTDALYYSYPYIVLYTNFSARWLSLMHFVLSGSLAQMHITDCALGLHIAICLLFLCHFSCFCIAYFSWGSSA